MTLGADGAGSTARNIVSRRAMRAAEIESPSALAPFLEACAMLAADAARRGDIDAATEFLARAVRAAVVKDTA
jgi:hypothetical protein